jgi:2-oxoglutarate dehydrogenase E1 component
MQVVRALDAGADVPHDAAPDAAPLRKPLIVMTPKSCCATSCRCPISTSWRRGTFQNIIDDHRCAWTRKGQASWSLLRQGLLRPARSPSQGVSIKDVALVRVEQLYPFPTEVDESRQLAITRRPRMSSGVRKSRRTRAPGIRSSTTCASACSRSRCLHYAGRSRSAAPACGHHATHAKEQALLVENALVAKLNGDEAAE